MRTRLWIGALPIVLGVLMAAAAAKGQDAPPPATPDAGANPKEAVPYRPIEGNVIVDLPSVDVPREGTLTMLFTHRFQQPVQDSTIHDLYSFDNGAHIGIGLWYAPIKGLNAGFYRSSDLDVYEVSAQYQLPIQAGGFGASLRAGEDWRTDNGVASPHSSFFAERRLLPGGGGRHSADDALLLLGPLREPLQRAVRRVHRADAVDHGPRRGHAEPRQGELAGRGLDRLGREDAPEAPLRLHRGQPAPHDRGPVRDGHPRGREPAEGHLPGIQHHEAVEDEVSET